MNGIISQLPMPVINSVTPLSDHCVRIVWEQSIRPHITEDVDLSPLIQTLKFYKPLRANKKLFRSVHVGEYGYSIAWGDDEEIDMAATSVERLAEESMSANDLREFLHSNKLTQERAAIILGRSRGQIANYLSGKQPIPRVFVLACFGYLSRQQQSVGGIRNGSNVTLGVANQPSSKLTETWTVAA